MVCPDEPEGTTDKNCVYACGALDGDTCSDKIPCSKDIPISCGFQQSTTSKTFDPSTSTTCYDSKKCGIDQGDGTAIVCGGWDDQTCKAASDCETKWLDNKCRPLYKAGEASG